MRLIRLLSYFVPTVVSLSFGAGCSNQQMPTYPVQGRVIFPDGSTAHLGNIEFQSLDYPIRAHGIIQPDGSFQLTTYTENDGAIAGRHRCAIAQVVIVEDVPHFRPSLEGVIDPRFGSYSTSGLEYDIQKTERNFLTVVVEGPRTRSQRKPSNPRHESHQHSGL
jgi:hypothetical protein